MSSLPPLIVLTGPTAVGKTALSLSLAKALEGEIISTDSMQVYRGMDIGTGKVSSQARARVPHHMIDVADPRQSFSVADYVAMARPALRDILSRGRLPFLVGGTGFYIQALVKDLDFSEEEENRNLREALAQRAAAEGSEALYRELAGVDPESARLIHPQNVKRILRALEYYQLTGVPISARNRDQQAQESPYRVLYLVLDLPREELYARISRRVNYMLRDGLVDEVKELVRKGVPASSTAMQGLGYKEVLEYLKGGLSLLKVRDKIILGSRHYAKRQLTWFRREKEAVWIHKQEYKDEEALFQAVFSLCKNHLSGEKDI